MLDFQSDAQSSCSSMASFMSGLLQESTSRLELAPNQVLNIDIVDDNATQQILHDQQYGLNRTRSLVTMRRSRSGRQLSRWSNRYERQDSDPNLMKMNLSAPASSGARRAPKGSSTIGIGSRSSSSSSSADNQGLFLKQRATSDTMLLRLPQRAESPRITKNTLAILAGGKGGSQNRSSNATWDNNEAPIHQKRPSRNKLFETTLQLSPEQQRNQQLEDDQMVQNRSSNAPWDNDEAPIHQKRPSRNKLFDMTLQLSPEQQLEDDLQMVKPKPNMFLDKLSFFSLAQEPASSLGDGPVQIPPVLSSDNNTNMNDHMAINNKLSSGGGGGSGSVDAPIKKPMRRGSEEEPQEDVLRAFQEEYATLVQKAAALQSKKKAILSSSLAMSSGLGVPSSSSSSSSSPRKHHHHHKSSSSSALASSSRSTPRIRDPAAALGMSSMPMGTRHTSYNSLAEKNSPPRTRSSGAGRSSNALSRCGGSGSGGSSNSLSRSGGSSSRMGARRRQSFLQDPSMIGLNVRLGGGGSE